MDLGMEMTLLHKSLYICKSNSVPYDVQKKIL